MCWKGGRDFRGWGFRGWGFQGVGIQGVGSFSRTDCDNFSRQKFVSGNAWRWVVGSGDWRVLFCDVDVDFMYL